LRLDDLVQLEACVDGFFASVAALYQSSDVVVLSALAQGADRLVARRALALGLPVVALLPMPQADYEADFEEGTELDEFRSLLGCAVRTIELPWAGVREAGGDDRAARQAQYALLGDALVANSAIVLALWNGRITNLAGGTDSVVAAAQHRAAGSVHALDQHAAPFVYHIVTPRSSAPQTEGEAFSHSSFEDVERDACLRSLASINRWNRDAAPLWAAAGAEGYAAAGRDAIARTFALADALAIGEQAVEQRAFLGVYLIGAAAALIFVAYNNVFADANWLLGIDVAITAIGFVAYGTAMSRNAPDRFQDYRALAEGLRVQDAWASAGIHADVADHYAHRQRSALDWIEGDEVGDAPTSKLNWIRRTIRVARQLRDFSGDARDPLPRRERLRAVLAGWIEPQAAYFARAAARKAAASRRCRDAWRALALGAFGCTVVLLVAVSIPALHSLVDGNLKGDWFFLIGMLTICSALVQNYADKRAFGTLRKQYAAMQRMFETAGNTVRALVEGEFDEARAEQIVFEIGREALAENADWMIALRDRPLEIVLSG
jgi:hypothetical protein